MVTRRRSIEATERATERRRQEDEAGSLLTQVPDLESLEFAIEERRGGSAVAETRHVRRFPVATAPALFTLVCADKSCTNGGHAITREVLTHLRAKDTRFEGEHVCDGTVGSATCGRVLRYVATATYKNKK